MTTSNTPSYNARYLIEKARRTYEEHAYAQYQKRCKKILECIIDGAVVPKPDSEFYGIGLEDAKSKLAECTQWLTKYDAKTEAALERYICSERWTKALKLYDACKFMDQIIQIILRYVNDPFAEDMRRSLKSESDNALRLETASEAISVLSSIIDKHRIFIAKFDTITISRDIIFEKLDSLINLSRDIRTEQSGLHKLLAKLAREARANRLTQADVALDFGVSTRTIIRWESNSDKLTTGDNKWGYTRELRTNPNLRQAYDTLVGMVKLYATYQERFREEGLSWRMTETSFKEKLDSINAQANHASISDSEIFREILEWHNQEAISSSAMSKNHLSSEETATYADLADTGLGYRLYGGSMTPPR